MTYKPDEVFREYRAMAPGYDEGSLECDWSAPGFVKERLERNGLLTPNSRIIDFATGTGLLASEFRNKIGGASMHITALDISPDMLEHLKTKRIADILRTQDITKPWAVPRQSFDIAAATGVGEYLTDHQLDLTIRNSADTLKKGGHVAFTYRPDDKVDESQKLHDPNKVRSIFRKAGFEIVEDTSFAAYRADNGETVNHNFILARKL